MYNGRKMVAVAVVIYMSMRCDFRLCCRRRQRTYIIVMKSATYRQVTCMRLTTVLSWNYGRDFRCLAAGRQTTTSDTTFPATSTSTTVVC